MTIMSESYLHLHVLLVLLFSCVSVSSTFDIKYPDLGLVNCRPHQIQAFTQFKNEFDTRACNRSDSLNGVWCNNSTGAVTKIRLRDCLSGILKPNSSLFQFHHLRSLDMGGNNFMLSSLPSEIGKLNRLEVLSLSQNDFFGPIPSSFSNLSMVSHLDLSHNELSGGFQLLRNLRKLTYLQLSYNQFSGTLNSNTSLFELHQLRHLDIITNNFTYSSLPNEFGNLHKLEVLSLSSNRFVGQVPPTLSNLTLLSHLYLSVNQLTGSFPLVQNLTKLSTLALSNNHFFGTIPSYLFSLPFLSYLDLSRNNFNGSIEVSNSSSSLSLESLYIGKNQFEAKEIFEPISKLTNLKKLSLEFLNTSYPIDLDLFSSLKSLLYLDVSRNRISKGSLSLDSYIPSTLEQLSLSSCDINDFPNILRTLQNMVTIDISTNNISGEIPEWLWSLPRLTSVDISYNSFTGFQGSSEVLVNSSVENLSMVSNNFEGALPHLPHSINFFSASDNRFKGNIPLSFCNRSSLDVLDLGYNNFTGTIPPCLSNLIILKLRSNNLEGSIPDKFFVDAPLRTLDVGRNRLTGKLPRSLLNCSSLQFLSVEYNAIKDTFPFLLKALPNLQILILRSNKFYGPISPPNQGLLGFPELRVLEIAGNRFTGSLPPNFFVNWKAASLPRNQAWDQYMIYEKLIYGNTYLEYFDSIDLQYKGLSMEGEKVLVFYATIDFSGNRFEGQIPESIGLMKSLIALNLSNNAFTGHIPLSLANIVELESLDLSRNQLSGTIPNGLRSLSFLAYINVSHNQLKGEIPQGAQIMGQPKSSFEENAGLCGFPLKESCFGTNAGPTQQPKQEENEEEEQVVNWKAVAISYGPGTLLGLAIAQLIASKKPEWLVKIIGPNKRRSL